MTPQLWLAYASLILMFAVTPGPAVILSISQALSRGFGAGMAVVGGVLTGNMIYFILSAAGLGAILAASEVAFQTIKYAGGAYLIFIGIRLLRSAGQSSGSAGQLRLWAHPFLQGLVNQLANPKSIIFYSSFLPQFVDYQSPHLLESLLILAVTGILIHTSVIACYIFLARRGLRLAGGYSHRLQQRLSGAALIGVGAAITLTRGAT